MHLQAKTLWISWFVEYSDTLLDRPFVEPERSVKQRALGNGMSLIAKHWLIEMSIIVTTASTNQAVNN